MTIYTNGEFFQEFPVPVGAEWRAATQEEIDEFAARMELDRMADTEAEWVVGEMQKIADQLLRIEDADPTALPGSAQQWREYRIALRAWKPGADGFPYVAGRPQRPE